MSLLKNYRFWSIVGVLAAISAYMIRPVSVNGCMALYILAPLAIGLAIHFYLDKVQYADEWTDANWQSYGDTSKCESRIPIVLWN